MRPPSCAASRPGDACDGGRGDSRMATYVCDGVVVASPTGSTGYSFSAGGPIIEPTSRNLVVTPIAAYLTPLRSSVVGPQHVVSVTRRSCLRLPRQHRWPTMTSRSRSATGSRCGRARSPSASSSRAAPCRSGTCCARRPSCCRADGMSSGKVTADPTAAPTRGRGHRRVCRLPARRARPRAATIRCL